MQRGRGFHGDAEMLAMGLVQDETTARHCGVFRALHAAGGHQLGNYSAGAVGRGWHRCLLDGRAARRRRTGRRVRPPSASGRA
jgi:hypothetical protein